jgi:lipoyl(octanoyl) transferase
MGVAVKRRVTMHGFALNVTTDLEGFGVINPCGLGRPATSMASQLGHRVELAEVRRAYANRFSGRFGVMFDRRSLDDIRAALGGALASA